MYIFVFVIYFTIWVSAKAQGYIYLFITTIQSWWDYVIPESFQAEGISDKLVKGKESGEVAN